MYERSEFMEQNNKIILTDKQMKIILNTQKYILEYCDKYNYDIVINYILNIKNIKYINDKDEILVFTINYNNFKYLYTIKMFNNETICEIKLKDNKIYSTNLQSNADFNTLIQYMLNDNN